MDSAPDPWGYGSRTNSGNHSATSGWFPLSAVSSDDPNFALLFQSDALGIQCVSPCHSNILL